MSLRDEVGWIIFFLYPKPAELDQMSYSAAASRTCETAQLCCVVSFLNVPSQPSETKLYIGYQLLTLWLVFQVSQ